MTLTDLLAAAPPRNDLVVDGARRWSAGDIDEATATRAAGLCAAGVGVGDHVVFQLPIGADAVLLYRACWRAGAVAVALHHLAGEAQVRSALAHLPSGLRVSAPGLPLSATGPTSTVEMLVSGGEGFAVPEPTTRETDDAIVLFTSGSSGRPKGVIHTHAGLVYKTRQSIEVHGLGADDVVLMPAPLAHVSGLLHGVLVPGAAGMRTVLMASWDPGRALDLIESEGVTYMVGPPTFFIGLMDHPAFSPTRTETLRMLSCGGAGVTPAFADRARDQLGAVVKRSYGSTEAPTVTTSRHDDPPEKMVGTDGRAFDDTRLRVDDGGQLWVRGPELARGYLDPAQTEASFVDGWFRTGDLARLDDGWLTITGRLGDRIIRGGENISAAEVEQTLEAHPGVRHAVAVSEPDERLGERVAAFVVAPDGFDLAQCRAWFTERGATRFSTPERIIVVDEVPVLASGKPDRTALRARLTGRSSEPAPSMTAAVYRRPGELDIETVPVPEVIAGQALVRVEYCGICGTDLHAVLDGWGVPEGIGGHEWSGRVVAAGPGCTLEAGQLVVGLPEASCGTCGPCRAGRPSLCEARALSGVQVPRGAFAQYVAVEAERLIAAPPGVDARAAAYTEPLAVALHAVSLGEPTPDARILVFGAGPIGAGIVAVLRHRGWRDLTVVEPSPRRRELVERLGAVTRVPDDLAVPGHPGEVVERPADVVFETSGARSAVEAGLAQLGRAGRLVLVGTGMDLPRLDTNRVLLNELVITGSFNYDAGGFQAALELLAEGALPIDLLVEPDAIGLDTLLATMRRLRLGEVAGKVLVRP